MPPIYSCRLFQGKVKFIVTFACYREGMHAPLVTVIIPTIGRPEYLVQAIKSCLAQTYRSIEVLVSDNCVAESSQAVCQRSGISDSRIRFISQENRLSFSNHMNVCLGEAVGEYVFILSDDDIISENYVEVMVEAYEVDASVSVALGRQIPINAQGGNYQDNSSVFDFNNFPKIEVISEIDFYSDVFFCPSNQSILSYISMFASRKDILAAGMFPDYPNGLHADNILLLRLLRGRSLAIGNTLIFYRVYSESSGLNSSPGSLIVATSLFQNDCREVIRGLPRMQARDKRKLLRKMKSMNTKVLLVRLKYSIRGWSAAKWIVAYLTQVLFIRLGLHQVAQEQT